MERAMVRDVPKGSFFSTMNGENTNIPLTVGKAKGTRITPYSLIPALPPDLAPAPPVRRELKPNASLRWPISPAVGGASRLPSALAPRQPSPPMNGHSNVGPAPVLCGMKRSGSKLKCRFEFFSKIKGKDKAISYTISFKIKREGKRNIAVLDGDHMIDVAEKDAGSVPRDIVSRSLSGTMSDKLKLEQGIDFIRYVNATDRMTESVFHGAKSVSRGESARYLQFGIDELKAVASYAARAPRTK
jgi:hypothetical protein